MIASMRDNDVLQMNAYCDGELDPASAIEFERRLVADEFLEGAAQPVAGVAPQRSFTSAI